MKNLKNKKGFTLIELIVVLAILGILMLILVPSFLGYANDAKEQVAKANTRTLWTAAKAAETKAEYDTTMTVSACTATTGITSNTGFCGEIAKKAGEAFSGKFTTTIIDKKITTVVLTTNNKTCTYTGSTNVVSCVNESESK